MKYNLKLLITSGKGLNSSIVINLLQGMYIECKPYTAVYDNHLVDLEPNQTIEQWCWRAPISILQDVPHCVRSEI